MPQAETPRPAWASGTGVAIAIALLIVTVWVHAPAWLAPGLHDDKGRVKAADFVQFYAFGVLAATDPARLYDNEAHLEIARAHGLDVVAPRPNYGPQVALAFVPLARLEYRTARNVFLVLSIVAYAWAIGLLWVAAGAPRHLAWPIAAWAAAAPAFHFTLRYGQTTTFALLFVAAGLVAHQRGRPLLAGFCLGLLAYKPHLGGLALGLLLLAGEWRLVGAGMMAVGLQVLVAGLVLGWGAWAEYVDVLLDLAASPDEVVLDPSQFHSIRGFMALLLPHAAARTVLVVVFGGLLVVMFGLLWRRTRTVFGRWSLMVASVLLVSPHVATYDLVLALVMVAEKLNGRSILNGLLLAAPLSHPISFAVGRTQLSTLVLFGSWYATASSSAGMTQRTRPG